MADAHVAPARTIVMLALALASLAVAVAVGTHLLKQRTMLEESRAAYATYRSTAVQRSLNRPVLPANAMLTVCNATTEPAEITGLISSYRDPQTAELLTFNSTSAGGHTWQLAPHSTQTLTFQHEGQTTWDGSTIFYALHVRHGGRESLRTGSALQSEPGCSTTIRD